MANQEGVHLKEVQLLTNLEQGKAYTVIRVDEKEEKLLLREQPFLTTSDTIGELYQYDLKLIVCLKPKIKKGDVLIKLHGDILLIPSYLFKRCYSCREKIN